MMRPYIILSDVKWDNNTIQINIYKNNDHNIQQNKTLKSRKMGKKHYAT